MSKAHIANHYLNASIAGACRQGHAPEVLLAAADVPLAWRGQPKQLLTEEQLTRLIKTVWRTLRDEFLGFTATPCNNGTFALMAEYCLDSVTLGAVLRKSARFYQVVRDDIDIALQEPRDTSAQQVFFRLQLKDASLDHDHLLQEFMLLMWQRFCCWLVDQQIPFSSTAFSYPRPAHASEYPAMYPGELRFDAQVCGFQLHEKYLQLPIVRHQAQLKDFLRESPAYVLHRPSQDDSLRARVRTILARHEYDRMPDLETLSEQLHIAPRSICRKLEQEGTSLRQIKAALRREHAIRLMTSENLSIAEVASRVGFSEPASFHRAFKRWTGKAPSAWRR